MNYILVSDLLWYIGHILTGCTIIFTQTNYEIAVSFVFIGQFITIISRPISRIKNNNKINIIKPQLINTIYITDTDIQKV